MSDKELRDLLRSVISTLEDAQMEATDNGYLGVEADLIKASDYVYDALDGLPKAA